MTVAALVMPVAPAHATYGSDLTVSIEVWGQGVKLSGAYGTIAFDDGNAKNRYSIAMCQYSGYTRPNLFASVNGGARTMVASGGPSVTIPQCPYTAYLASGEVTPGGTVGNVTLTVDGVRYNPPSGTYHTNYAVYDNPFN
ncbi:hypothetical protein AB0B89_15445 [Sphaerisporangium sp. NPDC049002]|uniref:hypothetical protein n=1 Tax=Sphaerisporangium sp. NPDC049002 TaxID=3155392 RepID=UPI0033EE3FA3